MDKKTIIILLVLIAGAIMWYKFRQPRFTAGENAPDFQTTLLTGEQAKLSDLKGKYVLLQFWGSWCGPCRAENPHLLEIYKKYHAQGFEIFSIGLESNPTNWQRAIKKDGMIWKYHSADFEEFDGELARQFNIKSIPATFLLNPDGKIMGVSLDPEQIDKRLSTALTN